jgi:transposase
MPAPRKYPPELRERAIRCLVREARDEEPGLSLNAATHRIGPRVGIVPDTLRTWCKQTDIDTDRTPGLKTSEAEELKRLRQEVKELKRANEIMLAA